MNQQETAAQQIALIGYVEEICEQQGLVPPVEVNIAKGIRVERRLSDFAPSPEWKKRFQQQARQFRIIPGQKS